MVGHFTEMNVNSYITVFNLGESIYVHYTGLCERMKKCLRPRPRPLEGTSSECVATDRTQFLTQFLRRKAVSNIRSVAR